MRELVCFNHQIRPVSEAFLPAASAAAFYGRGVFTSVAFSENELFQWDAHWRRLKNDASLLNLDLSNYKEEEIINALSETFAANGLKHGRARLTFFDCSLKGIWSFSAKNKTEFLIVVAEQRIVSESLRLTLSPYRVNSRSPLAGVKSCNYLENLLAIERAKSEKFDEAVRLNETNEIVSACLANVFWVKNGVIFTPHLETGALAGTTRAFIAEKFPVSEVRATFDELNKADEVFLTSAGTGAARAASFGAAEYSETAIFEQVRKSLSGIFAA